MQHYIMWIQFLLFMLLDGKALLHVLGLFHVNNILEVSDMYEYLQVEDNNSNVVTYIV